MSQFLRPRSLLTPEGVELSYGLASIGARVGALMLDMLISLGSFLLVLLALVWIFFQGGWWNFSDGAVGLLYLLSFLIRTPYFVISELLMNGRTLGKRALGLQVLSADGESLAAWQIVARNFMKEVEVWAWLPLLFSPFYVTTPWGIITLIVLFFLAIVPIIDRQNRRLGDMLAGTLVVETPRPVLLAELTAAQVQGRAAGRFSFTADQLEFYGVLELQTLEDILRAVERTRGKVKPGQSKLHQDVVARIRRKIGFTQPISEADALAFLQAFYAEQRAFLEAKGLMGDRREDKHSLAARRNTA